MLRPLRPVVGLTGKKDIKRFVPFTGTWTKHGSFWCDGGPIKDYPGEIVDEPFEDTEGLLRFVAMRNPRHRYIKDPAHFMEWMSTTNAGLEDWPKLTHAKFCRDEELVVIVGIVYAESCFVFRTRGSDPQHVVNTDVHLASVVEYPQQVCQACAVM